MFHSQKQGNLKQRGRQTGLRAVILLSLWGKNGNLLLPCSFYVLVVNSFVSRTISMGVQCLAQEG